MLNLDLASVLFLLSGAVAGIAAIYYSFRIARGWVGKLNPAVKGSTRRAIVHGSSLDTHIAAQWTEGRLRLDSLLALLKLLGASLEQGIEKLRHLDPADAPYQSEARQMVEPTLRRFAFDQHLRNECRVLIPLLQFCAHDLAEFHGVDMTRQLHALAEIQAAVESANSL